MCLLTCNIYVIYPLMGSILFDNVSNLMREGQREMPKLTLIVVQEERSKVAHLNPKSC